MVATKKIAAVAGLAAAAVLGLANSASAAPAQYTETSLNLNSSLASNLSGLVVAAPPNAADGLQRWHATGRTITLPGGGSAFGWQLRNVATQKCISDAGANAQVREVTCETAPGSATKQVWQTTGLKHVNGKLYWFWENATTHRKLKNSGEVTDGKFPTFKVIASTDTFNPGTAREALHLWNEIRVA
jgi:hypothetical protein